MNMEPTAVKEETWVEKIFSLKGRLNRKRYVLRALCLMCVAFIVILLLAFTMPSYFNSLSGYGSEAQRIVINLILVCIGIPLALRRLHDLNRSGWWLAGYFINAAIPLSMPIVGMITGTYCFILSLYALFFKGTDGPNRYGEDPLT